MMKENLVSVYLKGGGTELIPFDELEDFLIQNRHRTEVRKKSFIRPISEDGLFSGSTKN